MFTNFKSSFKNPLFKENLTDCAAEIDLQTVSENSNISINCLEIMSELSDHNLTLWSALELLSGETDIKRPFIPTTLLQLCWILLFGVMVISSICGNIMVIYIILGHKRMKTVTNYFLLNLTIADLMMTTFNAMFNFMFMLQSDWPFGKFYCIFNNFIANASVGSSVFTITATSIDR